MTRVYMKFKKRKNTKMTKSILTLHYAIMDLQTLFTDLLTFG